MNISQLLFIVAAVLFALDGFRVTTPNANWTPLGFCLLTVALWLV